MERPLPPVLDTPTRAARAARPQTRAWTHMISDATSHSATAAEHRRCLRDTLDAANRLQERRAALTKTLSSTRTQHQQLPSSSSSCLPPTPLEKAPKNSWSTELASAIEEPTPTETPSPSKPDQQDANVTHITEEATTPSVTSSANDAVVPEWQATINTFKAFTANPVEGDARHIATLLQGKMRDLRGQVVHAAGDTAVAAAPYLTAEETISVFTAALDGAMATKRVMNEACKRAAHALVREKRDPAIWQTVTHSLQKEHTAVRCLVLSVTEQLTLEARPDELDFVTPIVSKTLLGAANDKIIAVRDAARNLLKEYRKHFGNTQADAVLEALPLYVQKRLVVAVPPKMTSANIELKKRQGADMRSRFLKAKRAAMKKAAHPDATDGAVVVSGSAPGVTGDVKTPDENTDPVGSNTTSIVF